MEFLIIMILSFIVGFIVGIVSTKNTIINDDELFDSIIQQRNERQKHANQKK